MKLKYDFRKKEDFPKKNIDFYPDNELTYLYHGCRLKEKNGLAKVIDCPKEDKEGCSNLSTILSEKMFLSKSKLKNKKYITRAFYNKLKECGYERVIQKDTVINF